VKLFFDKNGLLCGRRALSTLQWVLSLHVDYSDYRALRSQDVSLDVTWVDGQSTTELTDVATNVQSASKIREPAGSVARTASR